MEAYIPIYRKNETKAVHHVLVGESCIRSYSLMGDDYIQLKFLCGINPDKGMFPPAFKIGDYCDVYGERFVINEQVSPTFNVAQGAFEYTLQMHAEYKTFSNYIVKMAKVKDGEMIEAEVEWKLTETLKEHVVKILTVLAIHGHYDASVLSDISSLDGFIDIDESYFSLDNRHVQHKLMDYKGTNVIDALNTLCSAEKYNCEWWATREESGYYKFHFGRRIIPSVTDSNCKVIETGINASSVRVEKSSNEYANRLYVYGGTQNVPYTYRKHLWFTNFSTESDKVFDTSRQVLPEMLGIKNVDTSCDVPSVYNSDERYDWTDTYYDNTFEVFKKDTIKAGQYTINGLGLSFFAHFQVSDLAQGAYLYDGRIEMTYSYTDLDGNKIEKSQTPSLRYTNVQETGIDGSEYFQGTKIETEFEDIELELKRDIKNFTMKIHFYCARGFCPDIESIYPTIYVRIDGENFLTRKDLYTKDCTIKKKGESQNINVRYVKEFFHDGWFEINSSLPVEINQGDQYEVHAILYNTVGNDYYTADDGYDVINGISELKLRLPLEPPKYDDEELQKQADAQAENLARGYIQYGNGTLVERTITHDDIFPSEFSLQVGEVKTEERTAELVFPDGTKKTEKYKVYILEKTFLHDENGEVFHFLEKYILDGVTLQVKFNTGQLAGMTFDVKWEEVVGQPGVERYVIVPNKNYGRLLPDKDLRPHGREGVDKVDNPDEIILIGWDVRSIEGLGLIKLAEKRLLAAGLDDLEKAVNGSSSYKVQMFSDMNEEPDYLFDVDDLELYDSEGRRLVAKTDIYKPLFEVGEEVIIKDYSIFGENDGRPGESPKLRVTGYETKLDYPFDSPSFTIGEIEKPSRLKMLENKLRS